MYKIYLILFLYGITLLFGCTDDEPICINTSAAFKVEKTSAFNPDQNMECNRCLAGDLVFTVLDNTLEEVKWTIGNDPRVFEGNTIQLDFRGNEGHTFTVTCMVRRAITTSDICIDDDGLDTFSKVIELIEIKDAAIYGKYEGYIEDNPTDIFTIELIYKDTIYPLPVTSCIAYRNVYARLKGLPKTCIDIAPKCWYPALNHVDKEFYFQSDGWSQECQNTKGWGRLEDDNSITIEFEEGGRSAMERVTRKFIGQRIN